MSDLPSISIVVPNYNYGHTLGRALQSLIDQDYPKLEIIVVDGGSTDDSVEVIKRYEQHIAWWVSEKDRGQTDAINKGFSRATGDIVNWLCSDDELAADALGCVGRHFADHPDCDVFWGTCEVRHVGGFKPDEIWGSDLRQLSTMPCNNPVAQPSCFYRRKLLDRSPVLDASIQYAMDFELWCYLALNRRAVWQTTDQVLSVYYMHGENKTATGGAKIVAEIERVYRKYTSERVPLTFWHRHLRHPVERFRSRHRGSLGYLLARPLQIALVLALGPFYGFDRVRAMNWSCY